MATALKTRATKATKLAAAKKAKALKDAKKASKAITAAPKTLDAKRTYPMDESLRHAMRVGRDSQGVTTQVYVTAAVDNELANLVRELQGFGLTKATETRPARLQLSQSVLDSLKQAGETVNLPASQLLMACITRTSKPANKQRKAR